MDGRMGRFYIFHTARAATAKKVQYDKNDGSVGIASNILSQK